MIRAGLVILSVSLLAPVHAAEPDLSVTSGDYARRAVRRLQSDRDSAHARRIESVAGNARPASPTARAIASAARKGVVDEAMEGYTEVLIQCQNNRSVVLTTALLRSDAQRSHCSRF